MTATHTPGPWRWEVNRSHKSVKLCGGPPKRGFGRYDLTVLGNSMPVPVMRWIGGRIAAAMADQWAGHIERNG